MDLETLSIAAQLVLQVAAALFSYSIYKRHRNYAPWLAITVALLLMTFRRVASLFLQLSIFSEFAGQIDFVDRIVVPLAVSILFFYALLSIKIEFDASESAADKAASKISKIKPFKRGL